MLAVGRGEHGVCYKFARAHVCATVVTGETETHLSPRTGRVQPWPVASVVQAPWDSTVRLRMGKGPNRGE
jgi:hypothetical protein